MTPIRTLSGGKAIIPVNKIANSTIRSETSAFLNPITFSPGLRDGVSTFVLLSWGEDR